MNKYYLKVHGHNYLVDLDGKMCKHGFLQHFFLNAENQEEAEKIAIDRIRMDEDLHAITQNMEDDRPCFELKEIIELESFDEVDAMQSGRIWYREKKWWQFWK